MCLSEVKDFWKELEGLEQDSFMAPSNDKLLGAVPAESAAKNRGPVAQFFWGTRQRTRENRGYLTKEGLRLWVLYGTWKIVAVSLWVFGFPLVGCKQGPFQSHADSKRAVRAHGLPASEAPNGTLLGCMYVCVRVSFLEGTLFGVDAKENEFQFYLDTYEYPLHLKGAKA